MLTLFFATIGTLFLMVVSAAISSVLSWRLGFEAGKRHVGISVATNLGKKLRRANQQLFESRRRMGDFVIPEDSGAFVYKKALEEAIQSTNCTSIEAALLLADRATISQARSLR
jgi:hypothetical protein